MNIGNKEEYVAKLHWKLTMQDGGVFNDERVNKAKWSRDGSVLHLIEVGPGKVTASVTTGYLWWKKTTYKEVDGEIETTLLMIQDHNVRSLEWTDKLGDDHESNPCCNPHEQEPDGASAEIKQ
jgi:hypothetical protein